jgi:ribosomal protein S27AE/Na+/serine symporter
MMSRHLGLANTRVIVIKFDCSSVAKGSAMSYNYKPGEEEDVLKRYVFVASIVVGLAFLFVLVLYIGLGIDWQTLKILTKKIVPDATNVTFVFVFVMAAFALWGLLREPAASDDVQRRQTYFILILIFAGLLLAGTVYFRYLATPTHEVTKTEVCPSCGGTGRAKLRPEYPCGTCGGTGYITP